MPLESLASKAKDLAGYGKEIALSIGAIFTAIWAIRDRKRKAVLEQMDITQKAQSVILGHVDTMEKLAASVDKLNIEVSGLKVRLNDALDRHAECERRLARLEASL